MERQDIWYYNSNDMKQLFTTKVNRVGTSLGIIIPKDICAGVNIQRGDRVVFANFSDGQFTVIKLTDEQITELATLRNSYIIKA